jgi:hypothetical protein
MSKESTGTQNIHKFLLEIELPSVLWNKSTVTGFWKTLAVFLVLDLFLVLSQLGKARPLAKPLLLDLKFIEFLDMLAQRLLYIFLLL